MQAGLDGIENGYELAAPMEQNLYDISPTEREKLGIVGLPENLGQAVEELAHSELAERAPTVAPYWSGPDSCADWPYPPTGTRAAIAAEGAPPIVVVGTTNDPATPYEWSEALAAQLASGVLVTRVGEGHTGYNKGNACVDAAVEGFLLDGVVPENGLRCE